MNILKLLLFNLAFVLLTACIMILASWFNVFQHFYISLASYTTIFFVSGVLFKHFKVSNSYFITSVITLITLFIFISYDNGLFNIQILPNFVHSLLSFLLGYFVSGKKIIFKILVILLLVGSNLFFSLIYYPRAVLEELSKENYKFSGKTLGELVDLSKVDLLTCDSTISDFEFNVGKVILIEFYFKNCLPCRLKDEPLRMLQSRFSKEEFEIYYVHEKDGYIIFKEDCLSDIKQNRFYDNGGSLANQLELFSFPTELLLDKNGKIVHLKTGFSKDIEKSYVNENQEIIKKLINEK